MARLVVFEDKLENLLPLEKEVLVVHLLIGNLASAKDSKLIRFISHLILSISLRRTKDIQDIKLVKIRQAMNLKSVFFGL